jgi:hypothetical protein
MLSLKLRATLLAFALLLPAFAEARWACQAAEEFASAVQKVADARGQGAARAAEWAGNWRKADLEQAVEKFVGESTTISTTETGKVLIRGAASDVQIVVDPRGGYFRIQKLSLTGRRVYLDMDGNVLLNRTVNGRTSGIPNAEYNELTHFRFQDAPSGAPAQH